ncbi:scarecrow-like protein 14 isoform X1 [Coffea arabica]|uniref:Scarecrow-like protein 14 isoform X1 n=1 Tax=Coffea arabica TaxID=13443 RepID=A0ABM4V4A7_COFAR
MDHQFPDVNGFGIDEGNVFSRLKQSNFNFQFQESLDPVNGFGFDGASVYASLRSEDPSSYAPFYNMSSELDFPDEHEFYPVLKYINQMLMEENVDEQPSMSHDPLAIQAAEKSFYEILGENYSPSPLETSVAALERNAQTPEGFSESSSKDSRNSSRSSTSAAPSPVLDPNELPAKQHCPLGNSLESSFQTNSIESPPQLKNLTICGDGQVRSLTDKNLISSFYSDNRTMLQFKKGLEEGNKFLPTGNQLVIDLDKYTFPSEMKNAELVAKGNKDKEEKLNNGLRGRKHQYLDDSDSYIGRSNKQSALYEEDVELSETIERALLYGDIKPSHGFSETLHNDQLLHRSHVGKSQTERQVTDGGPFDLIAMLISCAQFVASDDHSTANEQLKLLRQHASRSGDPHQRLAFIFVNALEARLAGNGHDLHAALTSKPMATSEELKTLRVFLCSPFRQIYAFFANKMILEAASNATTLHIVDFGITFGFQWPNLIQRLSKKDGGPPKLRITGINFPQPGLRPAAKIEQTGHRLAKYCKRFNVPFEYQAIATRNWEKITIEELKLKRNEVLAVVFQFDSKNILDELVGNECPRDAILSLIRTMNPDILVTEVLSAQLSGPFFLSRFREALFFFSTIFDALDNNLPRKDGQRMKFEQEFLGTEIFNIVACEGLARVERCETYKQWQARYKRAGFRQLPLNQDLMKELRSKTKEGYHKDFMFDEDGCWLLQGWKGKVICACSSWVPA